LLFHERNKEEQTILISSCRETCSCNNIRCLSKYCFINSTMEMVPTVPSLNKENIENCALQIRTFISYPFEAFYRVHYSIHRKMGWKITDTQMWKLSCCRDTTMSKEDAFTQKKHHSLIFHCFDKTRSMFSHYLACYIYLDLMRSVCIKAYTHIVGRVFFT
jgi:hypothetical protein